MIFLLVLYVLILTFEDPNTEYQIKLGAFGGMVDSFGRRVAKRNNV